VLSLAAPLWADTVAEWAVYRGHVDFTFEPLGGVTYAASVERNGIRDSLLMPVQSPVRIACVEGDRLRVQIQDGTKAGPWSDWVGCEADLDANGDGWIGLWDWLAGVPWSELRPHLGSAYAVRR